MMSPRSEVAAPKPPISESPPCFDSSLLSRLSHLRGVRWRINLCEFKSSSINDLRRLTADSRRRYAVLRRRLLIDPHIPRHGSTSPDTVMDNPLSENPDSMWGRFFRNAELEKMVDQDLSRLYPEDGSYFQTPGCQSMLRRILLLWCLGHPEYGYGQGMHELLAPLLYVLHADLQCLSEVRKLHKDHFTDKFDDALFQENDLIYNFDFKRSLDFMNSDHACLENPRKPVSLDELDPDIQTIVLLSDVYGTEGELGVVLSEKFMEHDVYSMFDALMTGVGGAVAMAEFFSPLPHVGTQTGLPPVIESSSALYHLLSIVDLSLYSHLIELGVEPQYFALRWLRVLFGREFSLEDLLVTWDEIFSFENAKLVKADEDGHYFCSGVLNSQRGAFISAMSISMILVLRSSLLASETATSCLQRLLNFPKNISLENLIGKAKSLLPLALDANASSSAYAVSGSDNQSKLVGGHSHSFDSAGLRTPPSSLPERYWEEKWRDLQKEEELKKGQKSTEQASTHRKSWRHKVKLRLSRTESDPLPSARNSGKGYQSSVRRNLLHDLLRQLGENDEDGVESVSSTQDFSLRDESAARVKDDIHENLFGEEKTHCGQNTTSEENSTIISNPQSPASESKFLGNNSEKCSFESNSPSHVNDESPHSTDHFQYNSEEQSLLVSDLLDDNVYPTLVVSQQALIVPKDRKSFSEKFHWLWKLGRDGSVEKKTTADKGADGDGSQGKATADKEAAASDDVSEFAALESPEGGLVAQSTSEERSFNPVNVKTDVNDQNLMCSLKSLGHSMLENIQVIESVFQQDSRLATPLENLSKSGLVEKGQVTAFFALKELRKISNLLSEM